jgi:hypothetical protein
MYSIFSGLYGAKDLKEFQKKKKKRLCIAQVKLQVCAVFEVFQSHFVLNSILLGNWFMHVQVLNLPPSPQ